MRFGLIVPLIALLASTPVFAQGPDVQRCVWSCLYGPGGGNPASPVYNACVARNCIEAPGQAAPRAAGDPTKVWQHGVSEDGTRYAGIDLAGRGGREGVYFFCKRGGPQSLRLVGMTDGGPMQFIVDGTKHLLMFNDTGAVPIAEVRRGSGLIGALQSNSVLVVADSMGRALFRLPLTGSKAAFAQTVSYC